jgi:hypothetical protein
MDLQPYVEAVRHELTVAARAGGDEAAELADRLTAPLESALRLALLDALSGATAEITRELAPRSVDLRLRGRDPEFTVTPPLDETTEQASTTESFNANDGGTWRVTLRLPEGLRPTVEAAARRDGISLNAWLVRAAAAAAGLGTKESAKGPGRRVTGWVR